MEGTGRVALLAAALGVASPEMAQAQATCLDAATLVEQAHELEDAYYFDVADKAVDARGVHWVGIPDHAVQPRGTLPGLCVSHVLSPVREPLPPL